MHWQPIETAPKDGTRVMLYRSGWGIGVVGAWGEHPSKECCGWLLVDGVYVPGALEESFVGWAEEAAIMPTHWILEPTDLK